MIFRKDVNRNCNMSTIFSSCYLLLPAGLPLTAWTYLAMRQMVRSSGAVIIGIFTSSKFDEHILWQWWMKLFMHSLKLFYHYLRFRFCNTFEVVQIFLEHDVFTSFLLMTLCCVEGFLWEYDACCCCFWAKFKHILICAGLAVLVISLQDHNKQIL